MGFCCRNQDNLAFLLPATALIVCSPVSTIKVVKASWSLITPMSGLADLKFQSSRERRKKRFHVFYSHATPRDGPRENSKRRITVAVGRLHRHAHGQSRACVGPGAGAGIHFQSARFR